MAKAKRDKCSQRVCRKIIKETKVIYCFFNYPGFLAHWRAVGCHRKIQIHRLWRITLCNNCRTIKFRKRWRGVPYFSNATDL
ncbi:MAG: hypothetical protein ACMUIU_13465 [bacterium]